MSDISEFFMAEVQELRRKSIRTRNCKKNYSVSRETVFCLTDGEKRC